MDEMISRSAAIEAIEKHIRTAEEPYQLTDADKVMNHAFEIAASCVYNLSATEADVPDINDGDIKCMKNDCISRQAVLKLLHSLPPEEAMTKAMLIQSVQQMDAAQPDGPDNLVNDCISRQAAIERIESHIRVGDELYPLTDTDKILNHAFEIAASCVYNLPSAQPERKRGRWIPVTNGRG